MSDRARRAAAVFAVVFAAAAQAAGPVAVVEDLRGKVAGIEFMDYVAAGRVIALGANDRLVLGYLKSCWRETITGGTVTVGEMHSTVKGGELQRNRVACDSGQAAPAQRDKTQSAATVFRSLRGDTAPATLFALSPLVDVGSQRGALRIERIDPVGAPIEIAIESPALVAGRFVDLAVARVVLLPDATYVARLGPKTVVFRIDRDAPPDAAGAVGRLLRLD